MAGPAAGTAQPRDAVAAVEDEVRDRVRTRGLDPISDRAALREVVVAAVAEYDERALAGGLPQLPPRAQAVSAVMDAVGGYGPLQRYLDDPHIEEIWINSPG